MLNRRIAQAAVAAAALALALSACNTDTTTSSKATKPASKAAAPKTTTKAATKAQPPAAAKSLAAQFKDYVAKTGTTNEKAAAKHVVKIEGGDDINNIMDTADIHTSYTGGLATNAGAAKLLASCFADFQKARGKASKNGLVSVYNASGDIIGNGKF